MIIVPFQRETRPCSELVADLIAASVSVNGVRHLIFVQWTGTVVPGCESAPASTKSCLPLTPDG
jgi:hypothetical protein